VSLAAGGVLWAAHAGDSRAVLARGPRAVRLTEDHKPCLPAERLRVEANGGRVQLGRGQRCWCRARATRAASALIMCVMGREQGVCSVMLQLCMKGSKYLLCRRGQSVQRAALAHRERHALRAAECA